MIFQMILYDLFLDPKRQYSCAYFKNETDTLETAQNNKIQHIIKKLKYKTKSKSFRYRMWLGFFSSGYSQKCKL